MADKDIELTAYLMRCAGFGAPRRELETLIAKGYETTVQELLDPETRSIPPINESLMVRY